MTSKAGPAAGVHSVPVRCCGLVPPSDASLHWPTRQLSAVIGPNGAGKTTLFNACSGLISPAAGRILLGGHDVTPLSAAARARRGLGRTFQVMELYDTLSVEDNVRLGRVAALAGRNPLMHVFTPWQQSA